MTDLPRSLRRAIRRAERDITPEERAAMRAARRAAARRGGPVGLGVLAQPLADALADPEQRAEVGRNAVALGRGAINLAGDIGRYVGGGDAGRDVVNAARAVPDAARQAIGAAPGAALGALRAADRGLRYVADQAPGLLPDLAAGAGMLALRHGPGIARGMTYGPFEDQERAMRARDVALAGGDQERAGAASREALLDTGLASLNALGALPVGVGARTAGRLGRAPRFAEEPAQRIALPMREFGRASDGAVMPIAPRRPSDVADRGASADYFDALTSQRVEREAAGSPRATHRFETPAGRFRVEFDPDAAANSTAVNFRPIGESAYGLDNPYADRHGQANAFEVFRGVEDAIARDIEEHARPSYMIQGDNRRQRLLYQQMARRRPAPDGYAWQGPDEVGAMFLVRQEPLPTRAATEALPMDEASRMARAREMGFDPKPLHHGTIYDFAAFDRRGQLGVHLGSPEAANSIAGVLGDGARILPVVKRGKFLPIPDLGDWGPDDVLNAYIPFAERDNAHPFWRDFLDIAERHQGVDSYDPVWKNAVLDAGNRHGIAGFFYRNEYEGGGGGNSYVVFDPSNIRSRFAAFDPARSGESDLLAGVAPFAALPLLDRYRKDRSR